MPSSNNETRILKSITNEESGETVPEDNNQQIQNLDQENMIEANPAPTFLYVFKKLRSYDLIACYGYIITFSLFPNASIEQKLFDIGEYNSVTVIALYNAFDTIGRYLVKYINPTKRKNFIIMIGRTILLFTIIFNYYLQEKTEAPLTLTSILLIINVVILGMTNGIGAAMTFGLAAESAEDDIKEQAGSSISFFSILGIFLGSCLAFATGAIIDTFKNKPNE
jgi:MFS family permease